MVEWTMLMEGQLRERALRTVNEIAEVLQEHQAGADPSLSGGLAGQAFLFAELGRGEPMQGHQAHAEQLLLKAAAGIEEQPLPPWLYGGFSGIAWSIERLESMGLPSIEGLEEIDEALLGLVSRRPWEGMYDLITGLVGLGVYALERLPRPGAIRCLEEIVSRLEERALRTSAGISWWTPPHHLPPHQRAVYREGYFNLGTAHGVPAVVALLALAARAGVAEHKARALAVDGARWVLAKALPESPGARFPACVAPGVTTEPCRAAWCYGDPGAALCLFVAARAMADRELERAALEIAREAAKRPREDAGVVDAGLCHGSAGLGHIYNRLYQASREPLFKQAALSWFEHALDMRRPGEGVAGYCAWAMLPGREEFGWVPNGTLLEGATGIALALHAACQPFSPTWDGLLMAAIPA